MLRARLLFSQVLTVCLLVLAAMGARAHEIRPALAEISFPDGGDSYQIAFVLNLEALIAGIGPEHDNTDEAPTKAFYDQLRAADPAGLKAAFDRFAPQFLEGLSLMADGAPLSPEVVSLIAPPVGDLELPRDSILTVGGALPDGAETLTFAWSPGFGPVVFRTALGEEGDGYSAFLLGGEASEAIPVIRSSTLWGGIPGYLIAIALGLLAYGGWFSVRALRRS